MATLQLVASDDRATDRERRIAALAISISTPKHDVSTYLAGLLAVPDSARLRYDVKQHGHVTARFSGASPTSKRRAPWTINMLTIPRSKLIKQCFGAPPGYWHVQLDLASQEPRTMANLSRDPVMVQVFADGLDFHRQTAAIIYAKRAEDVTDAERGS